MPQSGKLHIKGTTKGTDLAQYQTWGGTAESINLPE